MWIRFKRLIYTLIAKKYMAWGTSCYFLNDGKITGTDWVLLTCGVFAIDAWTKKEVLMKGEEYGVDSSNK